MNSRRLAGLRRGEHTASRKGELVMSSESSPLKSLAVEPDMGEAATDAKGVWRGGGGVIMPGEQSVEEEEAVYMVPDWEGDDKKEAMESGVGGEPSKTVPCSGVAWSGDA